MPNGSSGSDLSSGKSSSGQFVDGKDSKGLLWSEGVSVILLFSSGELEVGSSLSPSIVKGAVSFVFV